jgi:hypothetical protein
LENNNKITAFEEYFSTYKDRLERFLKECPKALEIDFIELEQRKYLSEISVFERFECLISDGENALKINGQTRRAAYYLNKKIIDYLTKKQKKDNEPNKITEIALKQYYIFQFENGKAINNVNAIEFFQGTPFKSTNKLVTRFKEFKDETNRINFISTNNRTDTKLFNEQLKRFEKILPQLKDENYIKAYNAANKEYLLLKSK